MLSKTGYFWGEAYCLDDSSLDIIRLFLKKLHVRKYVISKSINRDFENRFLCYIQLKKRFFLCSLWLYNNYTSQFKSESGDLFVVLVVSLSSILYIISQLLVLTEDRCGQWYASMLLVTVEQGKKITMWPATELTDKENFIHFCSIYLMLLCINVGSIVSAG